MSKRKPAGSDARLPLPSPRSPQALDDRILEYAADRAPARKRMRPHPWFAGLAAASVVGIAILVTEPDKPVPTLQSIPEDFEALEQRPAAAARMKTMSGFSAAEEMADAAAAPTTDPTSTLEHCAILLHEGREEQAREIYQQLRRDCPACELPPTLEEALEKNLEDY